MHGCHLPRRMLRLILETTYRFGFKLHILMCARIAISAVFKLSRSSLAAMTASWLDQMARAPKRVYEHYRRLKVKEELLEIAASSSASELVRAVGEVPSSVAEGHGVAAPLKTKWKKYRGT